MFCFSIHVFSLRWYIKGKKNRPRVGPNSDLRFSWLWLKCVACDDHCEIDYTFYHSDEINKADKKFISISSGTRTLIVVLYLFPHWTRHQSNQACVGHKIQISPKTILLVVFSCHMERLLRDASHVKWGRSSPAPAAGTSSSRHCHCSLTLQVGCLLTSSRNLRLSITDEVTF